MVNLDAIIAEFDNEVGRIDRTIDIMENRIISYNPSLSDMMKRDCLNDVSSDIDKTINLTAKSNHLAEKAVNTLKETEKHTNEREVAYINVMGAINQGNDNIDNYKTIVKKIPQVSSQDNIHDPDVNYIFSNILKVNSHVRQWIGTICDAITIAIEIKDTSMLTKVKDSLVKSVKIFGEANDFYENAKSAIKLILKGAAVVGIALGL